MNSAAVESEIRNLKLLILKGGSCAADDREKQAPESGFEPESEPRQGLFRQSERLSDFDHSNSDIAVPVRNPASTLSAHISYGESLDRLILTFSRKELDGYTVLRTAGLSSKSINWLRKAATLLWKHTRGKVSKASAESLRSFVLIKYTDVYARRKVINFAKAFLRYLVKTRFDSRYEAFTLFLELPKALKERKHVTGRIVTKVDVENILRAIERAYESRDLDKSQFLNYRAIVLFGAFTGQRPLATIAKLTVGQFREALKTSKPVLDIPPDCDKIRMQHYCPLHPQVITAIVPMLHGRRDGEFVFKQLGFQIWLRHSNIQLKHGALGSLMVI
ncbi:MAG: hypothetical protein ACXVIP_05930 [Halobacteriota archaeon]